MTEILSREEFPVKSQAELDSFYDLNCTGQGLPYLSAYIMKYSYEALRAALEAAEARNVDLTEALGHAIYSDDPEIQVLQARVKELEGALELIRNEALIRLNDLSNPVAQVPWKRMLDIYNRALAHTPEQSEERHG